MAKKNIKKPAIDDLQVLREAALISARQVKCLKPV